MSLPGSDSSIERRLKLSVDVWSSGDCPEDSESAGETPFNRVTPSPKASPSSVRPPTMVCTTGIRFDMKVLGDPSVLPPQPPSPVSLLL